jgi:hypothetical protein
MVKVKVKVKFTLEQAMKAQREEQKYSSTLYLTSAIDGVGGQRHAPDALPPGRDLVLFAQEAGGTPGLVWTDAENLGPTGFDHQSWEINVHIYAPVGLCSDIALSTCGTRTHGGTLRVSSCKQSYFEIFTVSQLNFKDVNRINCFIDI